MRTEQERPLTIWNQTAFEQHLAKALERDLGKDPRDEYMALYVTARTVLLQDVLEEIRRTQPDLTDHGPRHIRHVLENVFKLLEGAPDYFSPVELYVLGMSVLFHDVGNLEGRDDHNRRIAQFYDYVRGEAEYAHEKALIVRIAAAHTGEARNGTSNTLADVPLSSHLNGVPVRAREIAAIVRFADELAEGPQRTSTYLRTRGAYPATIILHHDYANATGIAIDGGNYRIAVTYQFEVRTERGIEKELIRLKRFLQYACSRLAKMDLERRYARHHCGLPLLRFQKISVCLEVQIDGDFLERPLEATISDEVNLDRPLEALYDRHSDWEPDAVAAWIKDEVERRRRDAESC